MPNPITAEIVEARMRDLAQTTVNQTVSLFKGATFALAAVLLLEILAQPEGRVLRLVLWVSSFALALTSYNAYLNTSVIDFRESVASITMIIVHMMTELVLFAALAPRYNEQVWRFWVAIYALFMFLTATRMLFFGMNRGLDTGPNLKPMLDAVETQRRRNSWRMVIFAAVSAPVAAAIILLPLESGWPIGLAIGFAAFGTLYSLLGLAGMHQQRLMMERLLDEALAKEKIS